MSRRNSLYTKTIDYTSVEEFLDEFIGDDPVPPSITASLKAVRLKFQQDRQYTKQSIVDAVHYYYESKGWNVCAIRSLKIALSNCSRDNSGRTRHAKPGWQMPSHQREAISKALKGKRWKMVDGHRVYTC